MPDGDEHARALDRAVQILARRDHSTESLRAKLERAGFTDRTREEVVDTLSRAGYLDDARFALERAGQLGARGYGDEWIRGDLESQGVPRHAADEAVAALSPERERAREQLARPGNPVRAAQALRRRGFSEDSLEGALRHAVADDP